MDSGYNFDLSAEEILALSEEEFGKLLAAAEKECGLVNEKLNKENAAKYNIVAELVKTLAGLINQNDGVYASCYGDVVTDTSRKNCSMSLLITLPFDLANIRTVTDYITNISKYTDNVHAEHDEKRKALEITFTVNDVRYND